MKGLLIYRVSVTVRNTLFTDEGMASFIVHMLHCAAEVYLRKIIPILEMVAGDAQERSCDSNRKLTFGPNWILSPLGIVNSL